MIPKPIGEIRDADLQELITAQRPEGRTIDYKSTLPGQSDEDKRKFLYDVTAFANTLGGDIVYGVKERVDVAGRNTGIAEEITGVTVASREQEELRLEAIRRSGVDPRIPGVEMRWIESPAPDRPTLVLRVRRSPLGPHMVTFGGLTRFYGRGTAGNFPMDVREIRAAFDLSGDLGKQLQAFRTERLIAIEAKAVGGWLQGDRRMVLHVVPISAFEAGAQVDLTNPPQLRLLASLASEVRQSRYNLDGYESRHPEHGYVQILRNGSIEAVDTYLVKGVNGVVPSAAVEQELIRITESYVRALEEIGSRPPSFLALSLLGVEGVEWGVSMDTLAGYFPDRAHFDRSIIALPELLIDPLDDRPWSTKIRPMFDALWQAAGMKGSDNYTAGGQWKRGARGRPDSA